MPGRGGARERMDMQDDQTAPEPEAAADHDPLLALFIQGAKLGIRPGITLMVGGLLVSGVLVGLREYLEGLTNQIRTATSDTPGVGPAVADGFEQLIAQLDAEEPDNESSNEDADGPYHFIHLKDARVRNP